MSSRGKLTRDGIVETALDLLNKEGIDEFSMRKLASELKVDPMAIYYHHANKADLLHAVIQAMMEKCEIPKATGDWQKDIRALCWSMRRVAQQNPGTFQVFETYEMNLPAENVLHEAFHSVLLDAGFSKQRCVQAVRILLSFTEAISYDEVAGWFDTPRRTKANESVTKGPFPVLQSLLTEISTVDVDADFEFGLDVLIRGLEREIQ